MVDRSTRFSAARWVAALAALAAALMLLPGLGEHGLWSDAELPVFDRVQAALGAALSDLERSPWLPDLLRTRSYARLEDAAGLRLPNALAATALVAMAAGLARMRGASVGVGLLAGGFALAFPMLAIAGRTTLGDPIGEALGVAAVLVGTIALGPALRPARAILMGLMAAGLVALSVASAGLALGGAIPLGVLAVVATERSAPAHRMRLGITVMLWLALLVTIVVIVFLSLRQSDGYIPLLGAAKDLMLVDKPENRRFAAGIEDLGYGLFPWAPLVIAGALLGRRDRLPALWLGLGVAVASGWSLVYGTIPLPVTVPAALCAAGAIEWVVDARTDREGRRLALALVVLGMLVMGKDAERTPGRVTVPVHPFEGEHTFPAERLEASQRLGDIGSAALWALLAAGLLAPAGGRGHRIDRWLDRWLDRLPARPRTLAPLAIMGLATLYGGHGYARDLVPRTCDLLSPRRLLAHHRALVDAGALPATLGNHRVRDEGLSIYGPGDVATLASRRELGLYLAADEPRAAIILARDLPGLFQDHRANGWPLYVLDDDHAYLRLVTNTLPANEHDRNPLPAIVLDEPPQLAHATLLRFEGYIEIVGWEVTEPVVRGRDATLSLSIRVLRPLPGGSKLYARLLKGRSSRINGEPQELTGGLYPPNLWREGDFILHQYEFKAPLLEIQPGAHELIVGLRRSEHENFDISLPEGKTGEHGVEVRGKSRNFAALGSVEVW